MTMPAKEAAKVLREHVEIRRKAGTGNPCVNAAIDAAVAALEAVAQTAPHPRETALAQDADRGNFRAP